MWQKYPAHPGLTAWAGDVFQHSLTELGFSWDRFVKEAGGEWPARLEDCEPAQVRMACNAAKVLETKYLKAE